MIDGLKTNNYDCFWPVFSNSLNQMMEKLDACERVQLLSFIATNQLLHLNQKIKTIKVIHDSIDQN